MVDIMRLLRVRGGDRRRRRGEAADDDGAEAFDVDHRLHDLAGGGRSFRERGGGGGMACRFVRRARERAVRAGCGARGAGGRYREHEEQVEAQAADEEGEEQASEHVRELVGAEEEEKG
jgi:hypothetical protein